MDHLLWIIGGTGLLATVVVFLRARTPLRATTLRTTWAWGAAALLAWISAWTAGLVLEAGSATADALWYAVSVLMLCPPIAVLGARRPGIRVWSWFVLLPLVLVFAWPAFAEWSRGWGDEPLRLATPMLLGYLLVMVMGLGNYIGTRFTLTALLVGASQLLLILPISAAAPQWFPNAEAARSWAALLLAGAALSAVFAARRHRAANASLDLVWLEFRDWFGIVWARRFMDRINDQARREQWPVRLELDGLVPTDANAAPAVTPQVEHAFRWLLRRFVDPEWIDERLRPSDAQQPG